MTLSKSDKEFWNEFLNLYRSLPYLWWDNADILAIDNRENYRMKTAKAKEKLLLYVQQRFPTADISFVQRKIHNFRCGFHREYRKKQRFEAIGKEHRPLLWYYKKLLFLVDEENAMDLIDDFSADTSSSAGASKLNKYTPSSLTPHTVTNITEASQLTDIKPEPIDEVEIESQEQLQHGSIQNQPKENPLEITVEIDDYMDSNFKPEQFETIQTTRYPVPPLSTNKLNSNSTISSSAETIQQPFNSKKLEIIEEKCEDETRVRPKKIKLNDIYNLVDRAITQTELKSKEDTFDVIGRKIANDLRDMTRSQRIFADKIINDVIYYGKANRLRSTFTFNPS